MTAVPQQTTSQHKRGISALRDVITEATAYAPRSLQQCNDSEQQPLFCAWCWMIRGRKPKTPTSPKGGQLCMRVGILNFTKMKCFLICFAKENWGEGEKKVGGSPLLATVQRKSGREGTPHRQRCGRYSCFSYRSRYLVSRTKCDYLESG